VTADARGSVWDQRFVALAAHIGQWSKDPSTKVGCVIVGADREIRSTGYNGLPRGVTDTDERLHDRELKLQLVCHAEENAVLHAARIGVSLRDCVVYVHPFPPCVRCARMLIQAGVSAVVYSAGIIPERWYADFMLARTLLQEAGIRLSTAKGPSCSS
jgi:dCMP deaminase